MMIVYSIVIIGSALLVAWLGCRLFARILREIKGPAERAELACAISAIAFFTVVSMPAGVLIAAILAVIFGYFQRSLAVPALNSLLPLAVIIALALVGVVQSPGQWPAGVPQAAFIAASGVLFTGFVALAERQRPMFRHFAGVTMVAGIPLMLAPLLFKGAHSSLALDHAILCAALLGGVLGLKPAPASLLLRLPVAVLFAYQIMQAVHYGAWPLAAVALLIWVTGVLAVGRKGEPV